MTFKEISELLKLVTKSNLTEVKVKDGDFEIAIRTDKYSKTTTQVLGPQQQQMMPMQSLPTSFAPAPAAPSVAAEDADEPKPVAPKSDNTSNYVTILSPIVGTFYRSPSPDKPPYLTIGDTVQVGDTVCIVEAMKLFNEIESEFSGKVVKVLVEEAQCVEYNQPLFLLDPH